MKKNNINCCVCGSPVDQDENNQTAQEFRPVHGECFDSFENADEYMKYKRSIGVENETGSY